VQDADELETAIRKLFSEAELRDRMGREGMALVMSGQGALNRTLEIVDSLLLTATTD